MLLYPLNIDLMLSLIVPPFYPMIIFSVVYLTICTSDSLYYISIIDLSYSRIYSCRYFVMLLLMRDMEYWNILKEYSYSVRFY